MRAPSQSSDLQKGDAIIAGAQLGAAAAFDGERKVARRALARSGIQDLRLISQFAAGVSASRVHSSPASVIRPCRLINLCSALR